jgi:hypothetical protein
MAVVKLWTFTIVLLLGWHAQAQDEAYEPVGFDPSAVAQPTVQAEEPEPEREVDCETRWGCWELLHTVRGTVLGTKATVTYGAKKGADSLAAGFVATYRTEHFATHEHLAVHFAGSGSLGGGSAGNEGSLALGLDFGYRANVSERSGPFLRAGLNGLLLGNQALYLAMFEPLQARVGYQLLDENWLLEGGVTQGLIPLGSYRPGASGRRTLARATELGGYVTLHLDPIRFDAAFMHVFAQDARERGDLELTRGAFCDYRLKVTVCVDAMLIRGKARFESRAERMTTSLYTGLTLGFSP